MRCVRYDDHIIIKGASMWGIYGQIEEKTKLAVWLAFDRMRKTLLCPEAIAAREATELSLLFPRNKKQAFQSMVKNADQSGWILPYQFERSFAVCVFHGKAATDSR